MDGLSLFLGFDCQQVTVGWRCTKGREMLVIDDVGIAGHARPATLKSIGACSTGPSPTDAEHLVATGFEPCDGVLATPVK